MKYTDYLKTEHWDKKKKQHYKKARQRRKCFVCGSEDNLHVHHNTYENLNKEKLQDLVTLCKDHHFEVHDISKELKISYRYALKIIYTAWKCNTKDYDQVRTNLETGYYLRLEEEKTKPDYTQYKKYLKRYQDKYSWKCDNPALS
jgi:hypothetical protein